MNYIYNFSGLNNGEDLVGKTGGEEEEQLFNFEFDFDKLILSKIIDKNEINTITKYIIPYSEKLENFKPFCLSLIYKPISIELNDKIMEYCKKVIINEATLFHFLCYYGCFNTIENIYKNIGMILFNELLNLKDKNGEIPLYYVIEGNYLPLSIFFVKNRLALINLFYKCDQKILYKKNNENKEPIEICFTGLLSNEYFSRIEIITKFKLDKNDDEEIQESKKNMYILFNGLLEKYNLECLEKLKKCLIERFNFITQMDTSTFEIFKKFREYFKSDSEIMNEDDMYLKSIMKNIDDRIEKAHIEACIEAEKNEKELLMTLELEKNTSKGKKGDFKSKGKKGDVKSEGDVEGKKGDVKSKGDVEGKKGDVKSKGSKGDVEGKKVETKGKKRDMISHLILDKKYSKNKKIKGILSITCFLHNGKKKIKEYSLHGLWPNSLEMNTAVNEIYLSDEIIKKNRKLSEFKNSYKDIDEISCFSNLGTTHPLHEWKKHGIYANNYDTIDEYIKESCDLALNVIKYLINCDNKHKDHEYTFDNMVASIKHKDSPFKEFFKQQVITDLYDEIHFNVCAIKENEGDTKYKWYYYNPSLLLSSDGKKKTNSIKRKSIKRKSMKTNSIKTNSIKRKSIKRKSIKRKSMKTNSIKTNSNKILFSK
jgi:hypothetical protein